jgi:PelA/Pel-15E family pectate lyase
MAAFRLTGIQLSGTQLTGTHFRTARSSRLAVLLLLVMSLQVPVNCVAEDDSTKLAALRVLKKAAEFYRTQSKHGGYVYHYDLDTKQRWGEGLAADSQIWVQPPGTPTVGMAFLNAYRATGEHSYLQYAVAAGHALVYGQLKSGGWTNSIDFDPQSDRTAQYRNGKGRGKNYSSLDDGQSQSAIRLMIALDQELKFQDKQIHESATVALAGLLSAQFRNGAFPQVWAGAVQAQPVKSANYPNYDWRTEGRIKEYWNMYTVNDNVPGYVAETLRDAYRVYRDEKYLQAIRSLGDFLLRAQMPQPQPGWAQQYNFDMQPIWARKFEPAAIAGDESQEVVETLLLIFDVSGDEKYLAPIPTALAYLKQSQLADGRLARFYELKTNKPLYMHRRGQVYSLTYDDSNLPSHYGWKVVSRVDDLRREYEDRVAKRKRQFVLDDLALRADAKRVVAQLDEHGRWVSEYNGEQLVGQPKMAIGARYLSSEVFSQNMVTLSKLVSPFENRAIGNR